MAYARVYVGAYWPGAVLAGLVFGVAVTVVGYLLVGILLASAVTRLTRSRLRPLLTAPATARENPGTEPDQTQAGRLGATSSRDCGDPPRSEPAPSAAQTWAAGPWDILW